MDEDRALQRALAANAGMTDILPVYFGGKLLAFTKGFRGSPLVHWRPARHPRELLEAAITTYDHFIAAASEGKSDTAPWYKLLTTAPIVNNYHDLWPVGGQPTAGLYGGAARTAVQFTDTSTGALYHRGNVSTDIKVLRTMTAKVVAGATPPTIYLYDRVITYEACAIATGVNAMTNTLAAQRYIATGQGGLQIMVTGQTVTGATASNLTVLTYVDNEGIAGALVPQTPVPATIVSVAAPTTTLGARVLCPTTTAGTVPWDKFLPLAAGDSGVRSITNYTFSAANTGTICFVLLKPLATIPLDAPGKTQLIDLVQQTPGMERIYDGACLSFFALFPLATVSQNPSGDIGFSWR